MPNADETKPAAEREPQPAPGAASAEPQPFDPFCPECGYNLRGLTSERCPECGLSLEFLKRGESLIPWGQRRQIGRVRAYRKTAGAAAVRTKRFCRAMYRPVDYRDAVRFRWVTLVIASVAMLLTWVAFEVFGAGLWEEMAEDVAWWFPFILLACTLLAPIVLTGVPSDLFHDKRLSIEQQNRATILSTYGCAPLALTPLIPLVLGLIGILWRGQFPDVVTALCVFGAGLWLLALLSCALVFARIAQHTSLRVSRRWRVFGLTLLLWIVLGPALLFGLPLVVFWLGIVYYSIQ
jgi:hypothetical protein